MNTDKFNLKVMSVNTRGLNDRKKRRSVFKWIKRGKIDICFVQESFSTHDSERIWKNEWGGEVIFSHGTNHSRGVLVLIRPRLDIKIVNSFTDNTGRILVLETLIQDVKFSLINIYAPNAEESQVHFYNQLKNIMIQRVPTDNYILLGGDFNTVMDWSKDRKSETVTTPNNKYHQVASILSEIKTYFEIQDTWRIKNPLASRYTWRRTNPSRVSSRLDFWLASDGLFDYVENCEIIPSVKSDHSAVTLHLNSFENKSRGRGYWKMNTSYLNEEPYILGIQNLKASCVEEYGGITDDRLLWELLKYKIREYSMNYGKEKAKKVSKEEQNLEKKLKDLETQKDATDNNASLIDIDNQITQTRGRLQEIIDYKTEGLMLRSETRWYEKGEKSNNYFLRLESRNKVKKNINKLQKSDGTLTTDPSDILKLQAEFYRELYSSKLRMEPKDIKTYLADINTPQLNKEEQKDCEGVISVDECHKVLKTFQNNKSPGNDGIPAEFYKKFWTLFGSFMVNSFNKSYEEGELSASQKQAVISLLDKGKDRTLLKNWRPISLLNVDYKLASKTIAQRITKHLPKLINENQVGYVQNRNITENIRTIIDMMEYLEKKDRPGLIINIDFEKAFDSVEWPFIKLALEKFNFGTSVIQWVETFYKNITSCVINNGVTSQYFKLERGVRQGDPLSPYLFILCSEILACKIRQNQNIHGIEIGKHIVSLLQYADDTSAIISDLSSAKHFLKTVETFGLYSGLKLNKEKTEGMWIGSSKNSRATPLGITWAKSYMKILGVYVSYDSEISYQKNFADKMAKAKAILNLWKGRNLTLLGRTQIVKSFVMSQFLYAASVLEMNHKAVKEIDNLIFDFVWNSKKAKIKRSVLKREISKGGLNIPDFESMVKTSRLKWITRIKNGTESPWRFILDEYLSHKSIHLNTLLHANYDINRLGLDKSKVSHFYIETLTAWSQLSNTQPTDKRNFIWYNKNILINNISVFYKDFSDAGLWYVTDLYDPNTGTLVPFTMWVNRGVSKNNWIKWMGLIKSCQKMESNPQDISENCILSLCVQTANGLCPLLKCQSKFIYNELLKAKLGDTVVPPRVCKHIGPEFDVTQDDWKSIYRRANTYPTSTKTREFQYKFLHDILVNDYWLFKWKINESGLCKVCRHSLDNIKHVFWDCEHTTNFWQQFTIWWNSKYSKNDPVTLDVKTIFFGSNNVILCEFLFLAKQYIHYKRRQAEPPEMNSWLLYISKVKAIELAMAKNNNTVEYWIEKWEPQS